MIQPTVVKLTIRARDESLTYIIDVMKMYKLSHFPSRARSYFIFRPSLLKLLVLRLVLRSFGVGREKKDDDLSISAFSFSVIRI